MVSRDEKSTFTKVKVKKENLNSHSLNKYFLEMSR